MVFLFDDWGMGEPQLLNQHNQFHLSLGLDDDEVSLLPLNSQVGGHTRLLLLDQGTICKPLNPRELDFYQNIPQDIEGFVPKYKGVMQGTGSGADQRYSPIFREESGRPAKRKKRDAVFRLKVNTTTEVMQAVNTSRLETTKQYFLLLENVTCRYEHPCVLDLKMGTRQHGDDASAEKRCKQMAKCAASTSASLGVRLCGMQVYQADTAHYVKRDKYWGRELDEAGLKGALCRFFHNGYYLRKIVVRRVIQRLDKLRRAIEKQSSFRFYSCSLLVVYEGHVETAIVSDDDMDLSLSEQSHRRGFGEAAARGFFPIPEDTMDVSALSSGMSDSPGPGWSLYPGSSPTPSTIGECSSEEASSSSISTFDLMTASTPKRTRVYNTETEEEEDDDEELVPHLAELSLKRPKRSGTVDIPKAKARLASPPAEPRVDVRMIDFAHTTFSKRRGSGSHAPVHHGPDCGFLTGLDSLKRLLSEILAEQGDLSYGGRHD